MLLVVSLEVSIQNNVSKKIKMVTSRKVKSAEVTILFYSTLSFICDTICST